MSNFSSSSPWSTIDWSRLSVPTVFAITVSYGRCHDSPTCACAPRWKTYGLSRRLHELVADQVVDRGLVGEVGEDDAEPPAQVADVVERARRGRADERDHVGAELDERVGQVRAHEAVGAGDEARAALVDAAEVGAERVELGLGPDDSIVARHRCRVIRSARRSAVGSGLVTGLSIAAVSASAAVAGAHSLAEVRARRKDRRLLRRVRRLPRARARRERAARRRCCRGSRGREEDGRLAREVGVVGGRARARCSCPLVRRRDRRRRTRRRARSPAASKAQYAAELLPWLVPAAAAQVLAGVAASGLAALDDYVTAAVGFAARRASPGSS